MVSNNLRFQGTVNNPGDIVVGGNGTTGVAYFYVDGAVALQGGGELILTDADYSQVATLTGGSVLTNVDHTIRGKGRLNTSLINQSRIRAEHGQLTIQVGPGFDNTAGLLEVAADGVLALSGDINSPLGDLTIEQGGLIASSSYLQDVNLLGPGDLVVSNNLRFQGTVNNPGDIVVDGNGTTGVAYFYVDGAVALQGGGELILTDANYSQVATLTGGSVLTNVDHTIRGKGSINTGLINQSTIRAEHGALTISGGSFTQSSSGVTDIQSELILSNYAPGAGSLVGSGVLRGTANLSNMLVSLAKALMFSPLREAPPQVLRRDSGSNSAEPWERARFRSFTMCSCFMEMPRSTAFLIFE